MEFTSNDNEKKQAKKINKAVAIKYEPGMGAPAVVAKGEGVIADKIIEKAVEADVKLYQNAELVEELSKVNIGGSIPPELYEVVAQVLIFVSDLDKMQGYRNSYGKQS